MNSIRIDSYEISDTSDVFFVAEIGINHNGSLELALELIDIAISCKADCVKFQKRTVDICVPEDIRNHIKSTPWGEMTYYEYKQRLELGYEDYIKIDKYCKSKGIPWSASSWDIPSIGFLEKLDVCFHKIPSALLTHKEYLFKLQETGKPIFMSTGMSTEEEIVKAVNIFDKDYPLIIMHTNSAYPSKDENLNLLYLKKLQKLFPNRYIGYSGHELGISASLVAATIGARVIERHITLDRAMWGTDQAASIEHSGLKRLVRDLKKIHVWYGKKEKIVSEDELMVKDKLRYIDTL